MAYKRIKTEHAGAKNGGGAWMTRAEAKENAKRKRRQIDKLDAADGQDDERSHAGTRKSRPTGSAETPKDPWTDLDPRPGDFDPDLAAAQSGEIEIHDGNPRARLVALRASAKPDCVSD